MSNELSNGEIALMYLQDLGVAVVPVCNPAWHDQRCRWGDAGKHPLVAWKEFQSRKPTAKEIADWWQRWPDANIAGLMGRVSGGRLALDGDPRNGAEVDRLVEHFGLRDCWRQATGGGGVHLIARVDEPFQRGGKLKGWPGWDVKAEGGYVILAPSLHASGRLYVGEQYVDVRWTDERLLRLLPGWQAQEEATRRDREARLANSLAPGLRAMRDDYEARQRTAFGRGVLQAASKQVARESAGHRHNGLYSAARWVGEYADLCGLTRHEIERELAHAAGSLGLSAHEVKQTIADGLVKGYSQPKHSLPDTSVARLTGGRSAWRGPQGR